MKQDIQRENDDNEKRILIAQYKELQDILREMLIKERADKIEKKFHKIVNDKSKTAFWNEKRKMSKNPVLESLIVKDESGRRVYCPNQIKEVTAKYYKNLYKDSNLPIRPFHTNLINQIKQYSEDRLHKNEPCNNRPTEKEISEIISRKKNGKSTTDLKNEMIKRPGDTMTKYISHLIQAIWNEERVPEAWMNE